MPTRMIVIIIAVMMALIDTDQPLGKHIQPVAVAFEPCGGLFADVVILIDKAGHAKDQNGRITAFSQCIKGRDIGLPVRVTLLINHFKQDDIALRC